MFQQGPHSTEVFKEDVWAVLCWKEDRVREDQQLFRV